MSSAAWKYDFDLNALIMVGYSNGANIASAMPLLGAKSSWRDLLVDGAACVATTSVDDCGVLISGGRLIRLPRRTGKCPGRFIA